MPLDKNPNFREENKAIFQIIDFLVIVSIFMNLSAAAITKVLVVEDEPDVELTEGNPVQAEVNDYKKANDDSFFESLFFGVLAVLFKQSLLLGIFLFAYLFFRFRIITNFGLLVLLGYVCVAFFSFALDLSGNLGYFLGKIFY